MEVSNKPVLSISQSAYIISKDLKDLVDDLRSFLLLNLFFLSMGWISTIYPLEPIKTLYQLGYVFLSISTVYFLVVFFLKSPYKKLKQWTQDYLDDAYTVVFNTTIPKGHSSSERILHMASAIFPQLREDYENLLSDVKHKLELWIRNKIGKSKKQYGIKNFNFKINSDSVDLVMKTDDGNFIIKDFKDKIVSVEALKDFIKIITKKFRDDSLLPSTDIFRLICVAKTYEDDFLNRETLERLMTEDLKANFPIDLIVEENIGYSVLWVGS